MNKISLLKKVGNHGQKGNSYRKRISNIGKKKSDEKCDRVEIKIP